MVYIDNMNVGFGRMIMCHMIADSTEELLEMADKIGVQRKWIQYPGTDKEHFDICISKKKKAIKLGAKEITMRELSEITQVRSKNIKKKKMETGTKIEMTLTPVMVEQFKDTFDIEIELLQGKVKDNGNGTADYVIFLSGVKFTMFKDFCNMLMSAKTNQIKVKIMGVEMNKN